MLIRAMTAADVAEVSLIEADSPSPWASATLLDELNRRDGLQLVAVKDGGVCGWCCAFSVTDEAELLKIAVGVDQRRQAIATLLLQSLCQTLRRRHITSLVLEVRENNAGARQFYARHGFVEVGFRPKYYTDPVDHALILRKDLVDPEVDG